MCIRDRSNPPQAGTRIITGLTPHTGSLDLNRLTNKLSTARRDPDLNRLTKLSRNIRSLCYLTQRLYHGAGHLSCGSVWWSKQHLPQPFLLRCFLLFCWIAPSRLFSPFPSILFHEVPFACFVAAFVFTLVGFLGSHSLPVAIRVTRGPIHPLFGFNTYITVALNWT